MNPGLGLGRLLEDSGEGKGGEWKVCPSIVVMNAVWAAKWGQCSMLTIVKFPKVPSQELKFLSVGAQMLFQVK